MDIINGTQIVLYASEYGLDVFIWLEITNTFVE